MSELEALGVTDELRAAAKGRSAALGRVVRQDRGYVLVATDEGTELIETRTARTGAPVVGDWVAFEGGVVVELLARRTLFRRADPLGEGEQALAANIDVVVVVCGLDRPLRTARVNRFLAQAWDSGARPLIVLSKSDLAADGAGAEAQVRTDHPGVDVATVSSVTGAGLDALRQQVAGATIALVGESGAGKSSLLNALAGHDVAGTGEVRASDAKGRHTTTRRELYVLGEGTIVIDTPGLRAVGIYAEPEAVAASFPDIEAIGERCRFDDCSHRTEPGCAVVAAVDQGELAPARYAAYHELLDEAFALAAASEPGAAKRRRRR